ncbi:PTS sugar transporter subunit IIB [Clostridium polynesiense]|uniref:PTS sugar transporter subunit IIB n=1 Tax=Clostridium polynesiense TaxID=1325933 RepID=UPI0005902755|nr:PTS sugar transporter subunit IIB [Clostridium polynesiense]
MKVTHVRIDDRLIHGQIVTAWIAASKAKNIIVADDRAAKDSMQQMVLKLTVPAGINLIIKSIEDTVKFLETDATEENALLIVRNAASALALFNGGFKVSSLNVGNISNSQSTTGRKRLLPFIYVEDADVQNLRAIAAMGISLDVRAVPNDKSIDGLELIKNL